MKRIWSLLGLILISNLIVAQSYTVSGFVSDSNSGERLLYATVYDKNSNSGCVTNEYGFYSLIVKNPNVHLVSSYVGYKSFEKELKLSENLSLNINLSPTLMLQEVVVTDQRADQVVKSSQMSMVDMPMKKVRDLPVFMGEADVIKTLQLLPGVQGGQEGTSGLYVRGGGPDQNLILLDGVPVYNSDHLFGFFSVFNPDAISSTKLIKGGFPARYGGRLSSVVDIHMKEGNLKSYHGQGSIGNISSKFTFEGPIIKNKTGFLISARRTYLDVLMMPLIKMIKEEDITAGYYFYDINAKVHHKFSDKDKLFFSIYTGKDKAYSKSEDKWFNDGKSHKEENKGKLYWGNFTSALRWNHVFSPRVFANTTFIFSDYRFVVGEEYQEKINNIKTESYDMSFNSGIQDIGAKMDLDINWYANHKMKVGGKYLFHIFKPGVSSYKMNVDGTENEQKMGDKNILGNEYSLYMEDNWTVGRFLTNFGLHYSGLIVDDGFYHSLQPRLSTRFLLTENISIKAAYARMQQYLHLLTTSTVGMPTDLWMPCTKNIKPQLSDQVALGLTWNINNNYDLSVEGFYKKMDNLIAYKEGAGFFDISTDWESKMEVGKGESYGVELLVRKNYGKFSGWLGYTLSWSWRQFDNLNFGKRYPYKFDRRHDISLALTYKYSNNVDFGLTWVYGTGNAMTLPLATHEVYSENDRPNYWYHPRVEYYGEKNSYRMPSYHRLDLSVNLKKKKKWGVRTWSFGLYNAYNRQNPFYLYFGNDDHDMGNNKKLYQLSLFPMLPFVRYSFNF